MINRALPALMLTSLLSLPALAQNVPFPYISIPEMKSLGVSAPKSVSGRAVGIEVSQKGVILSSRDEKRFKKIIRKIQEGKSVDRKDLDWAKGRLLASLQALASGEAKQEFMQELKKQNPDLSNEDIEEMADEAVEFFKVFLLEVKEILDSAQTNP